MKRTCRDLRRILSALDGGLGGEFKFSVMVSIVDHTYLSFPKPPYFPPSCNGRIEVFCQPQILLMVVRI